MTFYSGPDELLHVYIHHHTAYLGTRESSIVECGWADERAVSHDVLTTSGGKQKVATPDAVTGKEGRGRHRREESATNTYVKR